MPDLKAAALALHDMAVLLGIRPAAKADRRERIEARVRRAVQNVLKGQRDDVLARLGNPPDLNKLDDTFWASLSQGMRDELRTELESIYLESANSLLNQSAPGAVDWSTVNQQAADWARQYSYELVNGISATSRKLLQANVSQFYGQGVTMADLKDSLSDVFGQARADAIAVTEVTRAAVEGNRGTVADIRRAGMQMRPRWVTDRDELVCEICMPLDGKYPDSDGLYHNDRTGDAFESPPAHVNCRCMEAWEIAA